MGMSENGTKDQVLSHLKVEFAVKQKKGLPFIMASTVLWTIMLIAFLTDLNVSAKNMIAMCCSALLMPVGMLFGKSENWARVTYYRARVKIREELEQ